MNRDDADAFFGAAEYLRGVDVVGGEVRQGTAASLGVIDDIALALPEARVGWQRQRAWMEVQVQHTGGLQLEAGLVVKIQERCCQGLSASWASQRRTVDADMNGAMPRGRLARQFRAPSA
ncbi:putative transposase [Streptomyces viridochromogenes Tue57]|uniref:Putative transposase n=2 Tax=Streptomyces viridochromogenes TaxID=1938 RepID=L8PS67_STRVR|nr:putative transposase [Streptomyces viridochromogenes Tue57]